MRHRFPLFELATVQYKQDTLGVNRHTHKLLNADLRQRGPLPARELRKRLQAVAKTAKQDTPDTAA